MHLMVLGASRPRASSDFKSKEDRVSMHLMVLGASRLMTASIAVISTWVSMHLMVLGASRLLIRASLRHSY